MCGTKSSQEITGSDDDLLFTEEFRIDYLMVDAWRAEVKVNTNPTTFKLDTAADGTVLSDKLSWFSKISLQTTGVGLYRPGAKRVQALGTFEADLKYKGKSHKETFYVPENQQTSLLSRLACEKLGLVKCQVVKQQSEVSKLTKDIRTSFPDQFKGLGMLKKYSYRITQPGPQADLHQSPKTNTNSSARQDKAEAGRDGPTRSHFANHRGNHIV